MSDLMIKPLRAYEDRGIIRDVNHEPYAAPIWLAKELEQLNLCKIVSEGGNIPASEMKLAKKGQRWIIVDGDGAQIGDFIGKRDEAEAELVKLQADDPPSPSDTAPSATVEQSPQVPPSGGEPDEPPPQE